MACHHSCRRDWDMAITSNEAPMHSRVRGNSTRAPQRAPGPPKGSACQVSELGHPVRSTTQPGQSSPSCPSPTGILLPTCRTQRALRAPTAHGSPPGTRTPQPASTDHPWVSRGCPVSLSEPVRCSSPVSFANVRGICRSCGTQGSRTRLT